MYGLLIQLILIWLGILLILTIRGITPRYKTDVLITIIWKIMLPVLLCDLFVILINLL